MGTDLGTPRPLLSIHQSGASGVHTAAAEGWHAKCRSQVNIMSLLGTLMAPTNTAHIIIHT